MGTEKSAEIKRRLVQSTYALIKEGGFANVKARPLAAMSGCNPAIIYRYFESLDTLILVACVEFLSDYLPEILEMTKSVQDYVENYFVSWRIFLKYAFANPPVYVNMFFGRGGENLEAALYEHYKLFPEKYRDLPVESLMIYFNANLAERDFFVLRGCANSGRLRYDDAYFISRVDIFIVHGMLLDHMEDYMKPGVPEAALEECCAMMDKLMRKFLIN